MTRDAESPLPNRGKKILLAALVLGSLFGASTVAAMATTESDGWDMSIEVVDNSTPPCDPVITPATWSPVDPTFTTNVDLMAPPPNLDFSVSLMFQDGSNSCDFSAVEPTGTVTTTFTPAASPGNLVIGMMDCVSGCPAGTLSNDGYDGRLLVSPTMPTTTGTFGGRLDVAWVP